MRKHTILVLFSIGMFYGTSFAQVKWTGTWKCYSYENASKIIGKLKIYKISGVRYGWKYTYKNDIHLSADRECNELVLLGVALSVGTTELLTGTKGIKFVYDEKESKISVEHDHTDPELSSTPYCFGGDFRRKKID